jgi:hypothetical protein
MPISEFKVSDLIHLYDAIERDIGELEDTLRLVPEDREYASGIKDSIAMEIEKLGTLQKEILSLEISLEDTQPREKLESIETIPRSTPENPEIISTPIEMPQSKTEKIKSPRRY